jgi:hypothetical protein
VGDSGGDRYNTDIKLFNAQMKYLHDNGYKVLTMADLAYDDKSNYLYLKDLKSETEQPFKTVTTPPTITPATNATTNVTAPTITPATNATTNVTAPTITPATNATTNVTAPTIAPTGNPILDALKQLFGLK